MIEVNNGDPVHVSLLRKTANVMLPVGLKPFVIDTNSEADANCGPSVRVRGKTDEVISTFALVIVTRTVAVDELIPFVATNTAL